MALAGRFKGVGSLALDIKALAFGDIPVTTETQPDGTGAYFSPTFFTVGGHFSRHLTDRISLGITSHYIVNRIERVDATAISFSAGLQYLNLGDIEGLDMGVVLKHIGARMEYGGSSLLRRGQIDDVRRPAADYNIQASSADLPSTFEIGLAYRYPGITAGDIPSRQDLGQDQLAGIFGSHGDDQRSAVSAEHFRRMGDANTVDDLIHLALVDVVTAPNGDLLSLQPEEPRLAGVTHSPQVNTVDIVQRTLKQVLLPATREGFKPITRIGSGQPARMIRPVQQNLVNFAESHALSGSTQHQIRDRPQIGEIGRSERNRHCVIRSAP